MANEHSADDFRSKILVLAKHSSMERKTSAFDSSPELRRFAMQVFFPFAALIVATLLTLVALQYWSATVSNQEAAIASEELAATGLKLGLLNVGSNVTATATWDDAVEHLHLRHDEDWAVENVGNWATDSLHFEMVFVIDPTGTTTFGFVDGKVVRTPVDMSLGAGLQSLVAQVESAPLGAAVTGIVKAGDTVALVGAAAIHPHTNHLAPISGRYSVLIYANLLDAAGMGNLQRAYLLKDLALVPELAAGTEASIALVPNDALPIAYLSWTPDRPGSRVLNIMLPVLLALAIGIAVLAAFIFLYARQAAAALSLTRQLAMTDTLTGLPNRTLLEQNLQQAISEMDKTVDMVGVLFLDLDGFKQVNDQHGHAAGDEVLRQVALRLRANLRSADMIARVGGDEFVVVHSAPDQNVVAAAADRLGAALSVPIPFNGVALKIGASIGIAFASSNADVSSDLLRRADQALYEAKRSGGYGYRFASPPPSADPDTGMEPKATFALSHSTP